MSVNVFSSPNIYGKIANCSIHLQTLSIRRLILGSGKNQGNEYASKQTAAQPVKRLPLWLSVTISVCLTGWKKLISTHLLFFFSNAAWITKYVVKMFHKYSALDLAHQQLIFPLKLLHRVDENFISKKVADSELRYF